MIFNGSLVGYLRACRLGFGVASPKNNIVFFTVWCGNWNIYQWIGLNATTIVLSGGV